MNPHDDAPRDLTEDERERIRAAIVTGRNLEAIKLYRTYTGAHLVRAKDVIEDWERALRRDTPEQFTIRSGAIGCSSALVSLLALLTLWSWYASRPALVWYVSPPIDRTVHRLRFLVPKGWECDNPDRYAKWTQSPLALNSLWLRGVDHRPTWLRWLGSPPVSGCVIIEVGPEQNMPLVPPDGIEREMPTIDTVPISTRFIRAGEHFSASVSFASEDRLFYRATHSAICNSLRVE